MIHPNLKYLVLITCMLLASAVTHAQAPKLKVWVDRATVFEGESLTLHVEVSGQIGNVEPDWGALEENFVLGGTGSNTQMQFANGKQNVKTEWTVRLEPRGVGSLVVPTIRVGTLVSNPMVVRVLEQTTAVKTAQAEEIFLEVVANPKSPYVQQHIDFNVRLFHAVPILEGSLAEPEAEGLVIERMGDDVTFETERNGRRYRVIERKYSLFAEKSGPLTIAPILFQGRLGGNRNRRTNFDSLFDRGKRRNLRSESVNLVVRPKPASFPGKTWLPAQGLQIVETWPDEQSSFEIGKPVTRTVTLSAVGLSKTHLPEIDMGEVDGLRTYPDQATTDTRTIDNHMVGIRQEKVALVPSRAGKFVLPEIRVPWWDVTKDELAWATIPARTFQVTGPAPTVVQSQLGPPSQQMPTAQVPAEVIEVIRPGLWQWAALAFAALWLVTLAWALSRKRCVRPVQQIAAKSASVSQAKKLAIAQCKKNNARLAARAIISWAGTSETAMPGSLLGIANLLDDKETARLLGQLDRCLYSSTAANWEGSALAQCLSGGLVLSSAESVVKPRALPDLYPV